MIDTINTICKDIAPSLGLDEALVKKVYANYWKQVKLTIASGQHTSIWLRYLGTLAVSRTKVRKHIQKLIWRIRDLKNDRGEFKRKTREQMLVESLRDLRLMCARRNDIAIAYNENIKNAAETKRHMGESIPDNAGPGEQVLLPEQDTGPGEA